MGPLIFIGVGLGLLWLHFRGRPLPDDSGVSDVVGGELPDIVIDPTSPINIATGEASGSPEDIAAINSQSIQGQTAEIDAYESLGQRNMIRGATLGGTIGGKIGGPAGAAFGAVAGAIIGELWNDIQCWIWETNCPPGAIPMPVIPVELIGMPYRPDLAIFDVDGLTLKLPVWDPDITPADSQDVTVSMAKLREMFPGVGAVEACKQSGMFSWRPHDTRTPLSQLLLETVPGLRDYENTYLLPDTAASIEEGGENFRWGSMAKHGWDTDLGVKRGIIFLRRAALARELILPGHRWESIKAGGSGGCCTKLSPDSEVLVTTTLGRWLAYLPSYDSRPDWAMMILMMHNVGHAVQVCDTRSHGGCSIWDMAWADVTAHYSPAGWGFPGAWRLVTSQEAAFIDLGYGSGDRNTGGISLSSSPELKVSLLESGAFTVQQSREIQFTESTSLSAVDSQLAVWDGIDATQVVLNPKDASAGTGGLAVEEIVRTAAGEAFLFQVWLPTGPHVFNSTQFLGFFGNSHDAVLVGLQIGEVAWNPATNSEGIRLVYEAASGGRTASGFHIWKPHNVTIMVPPSNTENQEAIPRFGTASRVQGWKPF